MPLINCPTCKKPFDPALSTAMPFCSDRCRQVDLHHWLDEQIGLPIEREDQPEEHAGGNGKTASNDER